MVKKTKKTGLLLLIIAIGLGVVSFMLTLSLISNFAKEEVVFVAKQDIEKGDPLTIDMFIEKPIHPSGKPETAVNKEGLDLISSVSSNYMIKGDILRSEDIVKMVGEVEDLPLISTRLKTLGDDSLLGAEIPINSIKGMLPGIKKGDLLTVTSVYERTSKSGEKAITSEIILVNIDVIDVKFTEDGNSEGTVVIGLTKEEFAKLSLAKDVGTIHVAIQPLGVIVDDSYLSPYNDVNGQIIDGEPKGGE